jgi:hypothetical protein
MVVPDHPGTKVTINGGSLVGVDHYFGYGEPVSLTIKPAFGRKLVSVTETPDLELPITLIAGVEYQYIFFMPNKSVTVDVDSEDVTPDANVIYVRGIMEGETDITDGTGTSWSTAATDLQRVMDSWNPATHPNTEIWISQGKVTPDWTTVIADNPSWASEIFAFEKADIQNWSFVLKDGVKLYGGFRGDEQLRSSRDPARYETILSGDLGSSNKSKHVVVAVNVGYDTLLDGLSISGGYCLDEIDTIKIGGPAGHQLLATYGGGVYCANAKPRFINVTIKNTIGRFGGALFCVANSAPILINLNISGCYSEEGIVRSRNSNPLFIGGSISGNLGTGYFNGDSSYPVLINLTVANNIGNGIFAYYSVYFPSMVMLINVNIHGNSMGVGGELSVVRIYNSLVWNNATNVSGALVYNSNNYIDSPEPLETDIFGQGNNGDYPLLANTSSPAYTEIYSPLSSTLQAEVNEYLALDAEGNPRINGTIDRGAVEIQP